MEIFHLCGGYVVVIGIVAYCRHQMRVDTEHSDIAVVAVASLVAFLQSTDNLLFSASTAGKHIGTFDGQMLLNMAIMSSPRHHKSDRFLLVYRTIEP